jgi:hypothetical protein
MVIKTTFVTSCARVCYLNVFVDHMGHNLYWVDIERQMVEALSLTTFERVVVLRDLNGAVPFSLLLLPEAG